MPELPPDDPAEPTLRPATAREIPGIGALVNGCAERGLMLHRSYDELYEALRDFEVAVDERGRVVGVCGLKIVWSDLAEIYALAVSPAARGRGLGSRLVERCIEEARRLGIRRLMSLTYERAFFERLGFTVLDRENLPLKVWSECLRCPKNEACDEIAMMRVLEEVPPAAGPEPGVPAPEAYVVPVTVRERAPGA